MKPPEEIRANVLPPAVKERPILFSAPMVRALLAGSKTQTRRVDGMDVINAEPGRYEFRGIASGPGTPHFAFLDRESGAQVLVRCRHGRPGDLLWIRETHRKIYGQTAGWIETDYRATYTHGDRMGDRIGRPGKWTPSIHMPRAASRIDLEITGVRVERLQDISEADAKAEGIEKTKAGFWSTYGQADADGTYSPRASFRALWESINGAGSWAANPWLWVVEVKRIDKVENAEHEGSTHGQTIG